MSSKLRQISEQKSCHGRNPLGSCPLGGGDDSSGKRIDRLGAANRLPLFFSSGGQPNTKMLGRVQAFD